MPDLYTITAMRQRDIEQLFAASANQYPLYAMQQCGWLQPDTILDRRIQEYWRRIREDINPSMLDDQAECKAAEIAVETGIHLELYVWGQGLFFGATPQAFAREIARRAYIHIINASLNPLVKAIQAADDDEIRRIISEMAAETVNGGNRMSSSQDVAAEFEKAVMSGNRVVKTFIPSLDTAIGGMERQTEIVVAGRPSTGKTALVWQITRNVMANGQKVAYFSPDQSKVSLWQRAACPLVNVIWRDVLADLVTMDQRERLVAKGYELGEQYSETLQIEDTAQTTESIWQSVSIIKPDLVAVDHLRLLKDKPKLDDVKRLGYISQQLKEIAQTFNLPLLLIVQLSRDVEHRSEKDKRPVLADLRGSGEIEENADSVWMLYSDSYYNPPTIPTSISRVELWMRKFKEGPKNIKVLLDFDMRREWFEPVEIGR